MKQSWKQMGHTIRSTWLGTPALRFVTLVSVPVLLFGLTMGGMRTVMLLVGYVQLAYRAVLPGEPVENGAPQRAMALAAGLVRMLFFTGMMIHTAWPFVWMAVAQVLGLLVFALGQNAGRELSPLPLLAGAGFLLAGLVFGAPAPVVWLSLSTALALTLIHLLLHGKRNLSQLRMRFHLA